MMNENERNTPLVYFLKGNAVSCSSSASSSSLSSADEQQKMLLLDRDGIINHNYGYVHKKEDFDFVDGIFDLVRKANSLNYKVAIVTNQSGIARGKYSEIEFSALCEWMLARFGEQQAVIDRIYFCPHHPEAKIQKYAFMCQCRKPKTGMLRAAIEAYSALPEHSVMVGDKSLDMQCAIDAQLAKGFWLPEAATVGDSSDIGTERNAILALANESKTQVTVIKSLAQVDLSL